MHEVVKIFLFLNWRRPCNFLYFRDFLWWYFWRIRIFLLILGWIYRDETTYHECSACYLVIYNSFSIICNFPWKEKNPVIKKPLKSAVIPEQKPKPRQTKSSFILWLSLLLTRLVFQTYTYVFSLLFLEDLKLSQYLLQDTHIYICSFQLNVLRLHTASMEVW